MKLLFCNTFRFVLGGMQISRLGLATATYLVQYWTSAQQLSLAGRVKAGPDVHSRKMNFHSRNPTVLRQTLHSQALYPLSGIYHSFKHSWSTFFFFFFLVERLFIKQKSDLFPQRDDGMSWDEKKKMYQLFLFVWIQRFLWNCMESWNYPGCRKCDV